MSMGGSPRIFAIALFPWNFHNSNMIH